jgi:enolase-phosphatase E1
MRAVLTDIEGTTSSLSFVKDVLFPYARRHLKDFVRSHAEDPAVRAVLDDVRARENALGLDAEGVVAILDQWMSEDRKITPLKALQGMIWKSGYESRELLGHVYDDAVAHLGAWHAQGVPLYVYSSGSVEAQRLLFGHTKFGDLTELFSGFFDTTVGAKLDAASYRVIAAHVALPPGDILFLSDNVAELDAARLAGMGTTWLDRSPGRSDAPGAGEHPRASTFDDVRLG